MNTFGLEFHHFGLAVREPELAFRYLEGLGYRAGAQCFDPLQRVNLAMRHHAHMPAVEVIWAGDVASPIDRMLKRSDTLIYHLCYTCADVARSLAAVAAAGLEVLPVSEPLPAPLFGGHAVSFYNVAGIGLIEVIHASEVPELSTQLDEMIHD